MNAKTAYTGTHKVVLPVDYLNSIESAIELHAERIASVAVNLDFPGTQNSAFQRVFRCGILSIAVWLVPVGWMICL
jgi:hypothetical protein